MASFAESFLDRVIEIRAEEMRAKVMDPGPPRFDRVDESKLTGVLARLGISKREAARRVGVEWSSFKRLIRGAYPRGRRKLEVALGLEEGELKP